MDNLSHFEKANSAEFIKFWENMEKGEKRQIYPYTVKEMANIMDEKGLPKGLTLFQMIRIAYWLMFNRGRLSTFCWNLNKGMTTDEALRLTAAK